jgi:hypothetical protein
MPPVPQTHNFQTRLPPHVYRELEDLFEGSSRHFKGHIGNSDMVGALILRTRRDRFGLMEDLAAYLDIRDAWRTSGSENLPELRQ